MTSSSSIDILLSIDVEEDNWASVRRGITVENVREVPAFAVFMAKLGVRPTYFVNYQVALRPWAAEILRESTAEVGGEIAAHLHPWNTPPLDPERRPGDTMLCHYSADRQSAKIRELTELLGRAFGEAPTTFRAGRFALGPETISALSTHGYRVDSSVTPYFSWKRFDDGPSFRGAPLAPYRVDGKGDVRRPSSDGPLVEVPISCGLTRGPSREWDRMIRFYESPWLTAVRAPSILARSGILRDVLCSPETTSVRDMVALGRRIVAGGVPLIHMFMHATSLRPGLSPFVHSRRGVFRLYDRIERFLEHMARFGTLRFRTVGEVGAVLYGADPGIESKVGKSAQSVSVTGPSAPRRRSPRLLLLVPEWPVRGPQKGLPWAELSQGLRSLEWEVHIVAVQAAAKDHLKDHMDAGILIHGVRRSSRSWLNHATARARDVVIRFDPDAILSVGAYDVTHIVGHRARASRPIAHALDLSAAPEQSMRFARLLASWCTRAGSANPVLILTDTEDAAARMATRYSGAWGAQAVLGSTDADSPGHVDEAAAKLNEALRGVTDGWRHVCRTRRQRSRVSRS